MKSPLLLAVIPIFCSLPCLAETVSGVSHTRVHEQTGPDQTVQERFVFRSFVEGSGLSANSPFSSVTVQAGPVFRGLAFEDGRWSFEDDLVGVSQAQYSGTYPNGTYTLNGSGDTAAVSLASSYPNQPVLTFGNGRWQGGQLLLTAEQAGSELSLVTNQSNGDGFLSLEIVDLSSDEDIAYTVINPGGAPGPSISHTVPSNTLKPGHTYEVYAEFDQVTDTEPDGLDDGTTFAVASSGTKVLLRVQNEVLESTVVWTGPKEGTFLFPTDPGFTYSLKRSSDLAFGSFSEKTITGNGQPGSLSFDDSTSTDDVAFFRVERNPIATAPDPSAFAALIGGKTYRGFSFTSNNRWSSFELAGNWSYETTGAQTGRLVLTFDDLGNDPLLERDQYDFDFGADGNNATVETSQSAFENDQMEDVFEYTLDLTSNSFAPESGILNELLIGQTHLEYTFIDSTRFTFSGAEPGNWNSSYLDDDRVLITLTYDEDLNNPAVYREEITLNFNGTKDVPFSYREFDGNSQTGSSGGTVELLLD